MFKHPSGSYQVPIMYQALCYALQIVLLILTVILKHSLHFLNGETQVPGRNALPAGPAAN